jgi:hypothetical protein
VPGLSSKRPEDLGPGVNSGASFFVCYYNFVRRYMDEKRFEPHAAQTRHKKAMLYLTALLAVLVLIGFLL